MTNKHTPSSKILTVAPDIPIWFDSHGYLLDYHPNNHGSLSGRQKLPVLSENEQRDLIKGNNQATLTLLTGSVLDDAILKSFAILGECYHSDRIILFRNQTDPELEKVSMNLEYEWSGASVNDCKNAPEFSHIPFDPDFCDLYEMLRSNSPVIALTADLGEAARHFLQKMEIRSVVIMPVFVRNALWGFVGMGECHSPRIWTEEEVGAFHTVSVILGSVIQKHQDQEELTIARLRAEESDRLKTSILANINHELRTPMTGILGFSEIMCEEARDPDIRKMAENILISGKRLLTTLNSMIELSQFEARKALYKLVETKLNELILMACEPHIVSAKKKQLGFDIHMNESIFAFVEEKLFKQLLNHIIENAVKFTEKGKITVETQTIWAEEKSWSCIMVTDTGPGIPESFHQLIFEEFRQVSEGYNRSFEGNGLGLTLSQKIVTLMNGKLTIQSKPGNGCIFTIWLPSSQAVTHHLPSSVARKDQHERISGAIPDLPLPNLSLILIVEDNRLNSDLIQIYLRNSYQCHVARNGEEAIELAGMNSYQAILMDINLGPGIDGIEATRRIRKLPLNNQTPVIAVTGYTLDTDREEIMEAGCSHYLPKPINKADLTSLINQCIIRP